ncbi:uncharacterized protein LOC116413052 isoform X2 [Galleria mellonella]|uniref:Uncharacterized protein LOC116413052 isoform X2 n=1 Tax=Galleria mellonella TaxID=7137 RepID=A0ABM3MWZ5_GALME|nr:uncharacterized protein LOC116413052 isoform X2 [Galleria mellonella]
MCMLWKIYFTLFSLIEANNCRDKSIYDNGVTSILTKNQTKTAVNAKQNGKSINEKLQQKHRNRCCPYDFDSSLCNVLDDRLLCGFNRNVGRPISKDRKVDLSDGCRLRGGRLECGYVHGPFINQRRPSAFNNFVSSKENDDLPSEREKDTNVYSYQISSKEQHLQYESTTKRLRMVTRCVEIRDRIVCRDM